MKQESTFTFGRKKLTKGKVDSLKSQIARYSAVVSKDVPISLAKAPWEEDLGTEDDVMD